MMTTARTADTTSADAIPKVLGEHRELVRAAIGELVDRLDPKTTRAVQYHLGWCDPGGNPSSTAGGKSLRPTLALLGAAAAGGKPEQAVAGAAAAELVHNFSLVHDDLMDRDATRRHRPTVWSVWGDPAAVLTGDAMLSLAYEVLLTSGMDQAPWAGRVLAQATRELIAGQAADIDFEQRHDVTLAECLAMTIGKTSALLGASAGIGAILAAGGDALVQSLTVYGRELGIAFQLVDDLLGMWGNPDETGKPVHSDLRARKKTLPITWSIESGGPAGAELAAWMAHGQAGSGADDEAEVEHAADLVVAAGGRKWAESEARRRLDRGYAAIADAGIGNEYRQQFVDIGEYVLQRRS